MSDQTDKNYVSVGNWMWMMFVTAIPIIGQIMVLVWAFTGENDSRKNYFRAILAWLVAFVSLVIVIAVLARILEIPN